MTEPQISVILPLYNSEGTIASAVQSMLSQSIDSFEVLILNDGSTDRSAEAAIEAAAGDSRVHLWSRENRGLVASLNELIDRARGEFIARMDADDVAYPTRLEVQRNFLRCNPDIDLVGGQAVLIDSHNRVLGEVKKPVGEANVEGALAYGCPLIHPLYFGRKRIFEKVGGYRDVKAVEDLDFLLRAREMGMRFDNVQETLLGYRTSAEGMSQRNALLQMRMTRFLLREYSRGTRKVGGIPDDELAARTERSMSACRWFEQWRILRDLFLLRRKKNSVLSGVCVLGAFVCSLMHYELIFAGYRGLRFSRYCRFT